MPRRHSLEDVNKREKLGDGAHLVELRHQSRLAARGVVPMNDVLACNSIEHAQRIANSKRRDFLIALADRDFGLLHIGACGRNIRPVAQSPALGDTNALFSGFGICQLENPLAVQLQNIRHTTKYGVCAATGRWYQIRLDSTRSHWLPAA
jgi:hypothetical protein